MIFQYLEEIEAHKHIVEDAIDAEVVRHTEALSLLCSIPGINVTSAAAILAEIGTDMSAFPDAQHMSGKPIALDAEVETSSDSFVKTLDYNADGKTCTADARYSYLKILAGESCKKSETFRYDLNEDAEIAKNDVQICHL